MHVSIYSIYIYHPSIKNLIPRGCGGHLSLIFQYPHSTVHDSLIYWINGQTTWWPLYRKQWQRYLSDSKSTTCICLYVTFQNKIILQTFKTVQCVSWCMINHKLQRLIFIKRLKHRYTQRTTLVNGNTRSHCSKPSHSFNYFASFLSNSNHHTWKFSNM